MGVSLLLLYLFRIFQNQAAVTAAAAAAASAVAVAAAAAAAAAVVVLLYLLRIVQNFPESGCCPVHPLAGY